MSPATPDLRADGLRSILSAWARRSWVFAGTSNGTKPLCTGRVGEQSCAYYRGCSRYGQIRQSAGENRPEVIFHLAAQPLVLDAYGSCRDVRHQCDGNDFVLEAVRQTGLSCSIVAITTDKVYENRNWVYGYRETDALGGYDPYSASKAAAEITIASYRQSFFSDDGKQHVRLASVRAGNVVGGGDWSGNRDRPGHGPGADAGPFNCGAQSGAP